MAKCVMVKKIRDLPFISFVSSFLVSAEQTFNFELKFSKYYDILDGVSWQPDHPNICNIATLHLIYKLNL